jgi:hypothetical protein
MLQSGYKKMCNYQEKKYFKILNKAENHKGFQYKGQ